MISTVSRQPVWSPPVWTAPLAAWVFAVSTACAAPLVGPADASFYTLPAGQPAGQHGDLISYRQATVKLGLGAPAIKAWNVLYQSTDSEDTPNVVSGTVIVPTAAWSGGGVRPVLLYAVGTHGLAQDCAPSRQFEKGTDYESANIVAALKQGYAVLVTDYQGYLSGDASTYLAGESQGHAVLDLFKAAAGIPGSGVVSGARTAIWGYSQGGQSAAWAAQRLTRYAPDLNVVGVAAGGVPADFIATAHLLNGNIGFAFFASAIVGLAQQYPTSVPIDLIANDAGKAALARLKTQCVFEALFENQNKSISPYTTDNVPLETLLNLRTVNATLKAQNLGAYKIPAPLYLYHGSADEFIPLAQDEQLKKAYCGKFTDVTFELYPSEHIVTQFQAARYVLPWLADRLAGKPTQGSCLSTRGDPVPNANKGGGDFVVSLNQWPLSATVGLKTLGQTIVLPATSRFSAESNLTAGRLVGSLSVPDFSSKIRLLGISTDVKLKITPVDQITGSATVDSGGILRVNGHAKADITVTSVWGIPLGNCKTASSIDFPLDFTGPASSLGNGGLTFSGTTTFPQLRGCIFSALLSALMSGPGQSFSFTVAPPPPQKW